jgi:hypothetical protein
MIASGLRTRVVEAGVMIVLAMALGPCTAAAQRSWIPPKQPPLEPTPRVLPEAVRRFGPRYLTQPAAAVAHLPLLSVTMETGSLISESEPNDSAAFANAVTLGDTVSGAISPVSDIDWYAVDLTAGTVIDFDIAAAQTGSSLDAVIGLFASDGTTLLVYNDNWDGLDPRILYPVQTTGSYFVAVIGQNGTTGSYSLALGLASLDETEPNDTPAQATVAALDDTLLAAISPASDVDYFAIDFTDPVILRAQVLPNVNWFPASLVLYAPDGTTVLDSSASTGYSNVTVTHMIATAGRYYVAVRSGATSGTTTQLYALILRGLTPGPGDPTTIVAEGLGYPAGLRALPSGDLVTLDQSGQRLLRITPAGAVIELANFTNRAVNSITVDGYGDVLVSGYAYGVGGNVIWRITTTGEISTFVSDSVTSFGTMAVGPDGDTWVLACGYACPEVRRYDPLGTLKSAKSLTFYPSHLAFGPDGNVYATDGGSAVFRIGTTVTPVITDQTAYFDALAFDKDGYLYVGNGYYDEIRLYSPSFQLVGDKFAQTNLSGPLELAFGRDATGLPNAHLYATNQGWDAFQLQGTLVELNADGIRAPGMPVISLLRLANAGLDTATMGAAYADTLRLEGSSEPARWMLLEGALPPGVTLDSVTGVLSGAPTVSGAFTFSVRVTAGTQFGFARFTLAVKRPALALQDAVDVLLGVSGALTEAEQRFLDLQGNQNDRYDIGDLRAWLQTQAAAGDTAATAMLARLARGGSWR